MGTNILIILSREASDFSPMSSHNKFKIPKKLKNKYLKTYFIFINIILSTNMPDKRYARGCGSSCLRCWHNRLKHANPTVKKYMKKHNIDSIHTDEYNKPLLELKLKNLERDRLTDSNEYGELLLQLKLENEKKPGNIHTCEYNNMLSKLRS
jgi:hypothetical protein